MSEFEVEALTQESTFPSDLKQVNALLREFSPESKELRAAQLAAIVSDDFLFVARNERGQIIGMATLLVFRKPTGFAGQVEDVIVNSNYRGKGIGRELMIAMIKMAKILNLKYLSLTSNERRIAAHGLYKSLGFNIKETTFFRLML